MADSVADIDVFLQADAEPKSSWVFLALGIIIALLSLTIYSIIFPGQNLPVISDLETFASLKGQVWLFILGMLVWPYGKEGSVYCNPDSILQIHGLWHLLCAFATWCFYIHFMSERIVQSDDEE